MTLVDLMVLVLGTGGMVATLHHDHTIQVPARPNKEEEEEEEYPIWDQMGMGFLWMYTIAFLLSGSVFLMLIGFVLLAIVLP